MIISKEFALAVPTAAKVSLIRHILSERIIGQRSYVDAVSVALLAKANVFLKSPPGTAKSALVHLLGDLLRNPENPAERPANTSAVLMPGVSRTDLIGDLDLTALASGRAVYALSKTARSNVVLFDEIFKADPTLLNVLLNWINERLLTLPNPALVPVEDLPLYPPKDRERARLEEWPDGGVRAVFQPPVPVPLVTAIGASNEVPEDEELEALYNRFHIKVFSHYLRDFDLIQKAYRSRWHTRKETWERPSAEYAEYSITFRLDAASAFLAGLRESPEKLERVLEGGAIIRIKLAKGGSVTAESPEDVLSLKPGDVAAVRITLPRGSESAWLTTEDLWDLSLPGVMEVRLGSAGVSLADAVLATVVLPIFVIREDPNRFGYSIEEDEVPKFASDRDLISVIPSIAGAYALLEGLLAAPAGVPPEREFMVFGWSPLPVLTSIFKVLDWRKWGDEAPDSRSLKQFKLSDASELSEAAVAVAFEVRRGLLSVETINDKMVAKIAEARHFLESRKQIPDEVLDGVEDARSGLAAEITRTEDLMNRIKSELKVEDGKIKDVAIALLEEHKAVLEKLYSLATAILKFGKKR